MKLLDAVAAATTTVDTMHAAVAVAVPASADKCASSTIVGTMHACIAETVHHPSFYRFMEGFGFSRCSDLSHKLEAHVTQAMPAFRGRMVLSCFTMVTPTGTMANGDSKNATMSLCTANMC